MFYHPQDHVILFCRFYNMTQTPGTHYAAFCRNLGFVSASWPKRCSRNTLQRQLCQNILSCQQTTNCQTVCSLHAVSYATTSLSGGFAWQAAVDCSNARYHYCQKLGAAHHHHHASSLEPVLSFRLFFKFVSYIRLGWHKLGSLRWINKLTHPFYCIN